MNSGALLWALSFGVTEATLPGGSVLSRRVPDVIARALRLGRQLEARWSPLVVDVEEGLGYAVPVATSEEMKPADALAELGGGDFLLYGQLEASPRWVWLDGRLYSNRHGEVLIYPRFAGTPELFLENLESIVDEIAMAAGVTSANPEAWQELDPLTALSQSSARPAAWEGPEWRWDSLYTRVWEAFEHLCAALDSPRSTDPGPEEESAALRHVLAAIERDPQFGLAAEFGLEMAQQARRRESVEHSLDVADLLSARCPDLPAIPLFRAGILREIGCLEDARREDEHARLLARRRARPDF